MTTCAVPGCGRDLYCKEKCWAHYMRARRGADMSAPFQPKRKGTARAGSPCRADGCGRPSVSMGLCAGHYRTERRYGLGPEQIAARVVEQGGCAICRRSDARKWFVDHDHATGAVRGVLCPSCNSGLGMFRDSPDNLRAAIEYLAAHAKEAA